MLTFDVIRSQSIAWVKIDSVVYFNQLVFNASNSIDGQAANLFEPLTNFGKQFRIACVICKRKDDRFC